MKGKPPDRQRHLDPGPVRIRCPTGPFHGDHPAKNLAGLDGSIGSFQGVSLEEKRRCSIDIHNTMSDRSPSVPVKDDISFPDLRGLDRSHCQEIAMEDRGGHAHPAGAKADALPGLQKLCAEFDKGVLSVHHSPGVVQSFC
jgi:hypothetical protein